MLMPTFQGDGDIGRADLDGATAALEVFAGGGVKCV